MGPQLDLAIAAPFEFVGAVNDAGVVHVLYGGSLGLSSTGSQLWHQNSPNVAGTVDPNDFFGRALTAANLGRGPRAELVIGVHGESVGAQGGAGAVNVIYGAPAGLSAVGTQLWHQNSSSIVDVAEGGDAFGFALDAANFGRGAQADLAVGAPREAVGTLAEAGAVNVIYGAPAGLSSPGNQFWHQDALPPWESADAFDEFGSALAAWDFGRSAESDLAVGVPNEDFPGLVDAGAVNVVYGSTGGLSVADNQLFWELVVNFPVEPEGRFGEALTQSPCFGFDRPSCPGQ
jgi:hypothetical protein